MNRIMMLKAGSSAIHKLGDIGRDHDSEIRVFDENDEFYIGHFEEGFGFVDVKFPKENVRPLTEDEIMHKNKQWMCINGHPMFKLNFDLDGNVIPND